MPQENPFLCWPPGTEPEDKVDWEIVKPVLLWARDADDARKVLARTITDAADWEIEPWKMWRDDRYDKKGN
jgi:hypothetical protein